MPLRSNPQVRLRVHGAFDNWRRSETLFSVSTRQKFSIVVALSQRIVPRAAHAGGAVERSVQAPPAPRRTLRKSHQFSPMAKDGRLSYRQRANPRIGRCRSLTFSPARPAHTGLNPCRSRSRRLSIRRHVVGPDAADGKDQRIARQDRAPCLERPGGSASPETS
jgi:hypothetical protein